MPDLTFPPAIRIRRAPVTGTLHDLVVLTYDERMLRRKRLVTQHDEAFLVDLPETVSLDQGDAFELADGRLIGVMATEEVLMEVRGDLPRLAWHIGNRHAPCQIEPDRLVIQTDRVLRQMLLGLGAVVRDIREPFSPEGGAYGHGRTLGHSHGPEVVIPHSHGFDHDHTYMPPHPHDHEH